MTDYGATDTSTTTLGTNQFPANSVFIPGDTKLTVVGGANKTTDVNGKTYADALVAILDGHDVTQGTSTDANTVNSVMGRLTKIRDLLNTTLAVTQSGTWNIANISGTVSLPTGASTSAKQPALGTAGTASSDVLTVQGIASMTALKVDGSGVTQPVSLTSTTITGTVAVTESGAWNVRIQDGSGNALTTNSSTYTAKFALDGNLLGTLGTAFSTAGKVDVKGADGDVFVRQTTGSNLHVQIDNSTLAVTESGTWTVQPGNTQNTMPWLTFPGITFTTLSAWNSSTGSNATQNIYTNSGASAALIQLDQTTTLTGGAITFEVNYDGTNWVSPPANTILDPTSATYAQIANPYTLQASTNKPFLLVSNGWQSLRIRLSTVISGTGTVTPYYALLAFNPVQQSIVYSPTAANFQATATQGGTWTVQQGGSNWSENVTQFGGTNLSTGTGAGGAGIPRVTVSNDSTVGSNSATGAAVPANAFSVGGLAKTALPSAASDGNLTGALLDKFGRIIVVPETVRDLKSNIPGLTLTTTGETTLIAAAASVFNDINSLICLNTSATAVRVDFRDSTGGTIQFSLYVPAGDTRGFSSCFYKQGTVNTNWTAQLSAAVTDVRIYGTYVANK